MKRSIYSILMPAPNVTGHIHVGHGFNLAIQDVIARWWSRKGKDIYWPPGLDHGGIATQHTVEHWLAGKGESINSLGREGFMLEINKWKSDKSALIHHDMATLDLLLSWKFAWYTMDEARNRAVTEAFVRLYHEGFIYRDDGIVNWCPRCRTALSDLELSLREVTLPHFRLKATVESGAGQIPVNVVRPELILGTTAIAVRRNGEYSHHIGEHAILPLGGKYVPVIAGDDFGSHFHDGGVMVCPAHSPRDFHAAREQGLDIVDVFTEDGLIASGFGEFSGLAIAACRERIVERLTHERALTMMGQVRYGHAHCYRCGHEVLPKSSMQWYLRTAELAPPVIDSVESGDMTFNSEKWHHAFLGWMNKLAGNKRMEKANWWEGACLSVTMGYSSSRDWVISRQILWGHPIPAWNCPHCGYMEVAAKTPDCCSQCGADGLEKEQGVLDMWFSCATWPLSVAGWPHDPIWRERLPFDVTVIGHDVLYFWVTATNMLSQRLVGRPSFRHVYIHGLLADANGKKMTKSLGNVINVEEAITRWGSDVFRSAMIRLAAGRADDEYLSLSPEHFLAAQEQLNRTVAALRQALAGQDVFENNELVDALEEASQTLVEQFKLAEALEIIESWIDTHDKSICSASARRLVGLLDSFYPQAMRHLAGKNVLTSVDC